MLKIGLIAMSGVRVGTEKLAKAGVSLPGFVDRGKVVASLPSLGLLTVAALTPSDVEVEYLEVDDMPNKSDLKKFDLVGISSFTARINDAYKLSSMYRELGVPVVLGGLHVTLMPEEASRYADSIVVNGAEGAWPELIEDFKSGAMKPKYNGLRSGVFESPNYVVPKFEFLKGRPYNRITVQTSRGCPLHCEFCAASIRLTSSFQQKPVKEAIEEIKLALNAVDNPFFEFADDNTFVNKKWGREFLTALEPLNIRWFTETDISIVDDEELLELMAKSGCHQVLIGLESPSSSDLSGINPNDWKAKKAKSYIEAIDKIQSKGITVNGCFVLGLDSHTPNIFKEVKEFVETSRLIEVQVTAMTAFPGTPLYDRLKAEGRLLTEEYWDRCTLFDVNYQPKNMSVQQLEEGLLYLFRELYNEEAFQKRKRHYMEIIKNKIK